jgi:hypothetical protein
MRRLYAWSFSIGACDMPIKVTSRALRWASMPSKWSASCEQPGHAAVQSGPNMMW